LSSLLRNPLLAWDTFELEAPADPRSAASARALGLGISPADVEVERRRAFAEGRASAEAEFAAERERSRSSVAASVEQLQRVATALAAARAALLREAAEQVVGLAADLGRRIVRRELSVDPAAAVPLVRELLLRVAAAERVVVKVCPRDLRACREILGGSTELSESARLIADPGLSPGDCLVETERGRLDARIATQLDRMEAALGVQRKPDETADDSGDAGDAADETRVAS